jgi:hypothetical protein
MPLPLHLLGLPPPLSKNSNHHQTNGGANNYTSEHKPIKKPNILHNKKARLSRFISPRERNKNKTKKIVAVPMTISGNPLLTSS